MRLSLLCLAIGLGIAGCASPQPAGLPPEPVTATGLAPGIGDCSFANLTTLDSGRLAVAHAKPKPPYYTQRSLTGPIGFDVDIANELGEGLGFEASQLGWSKLDRVFDRDGHPNFDIAIAQLQKQKFSASLEFSGPYFTETQVLLALPDTPITKVTSTSELVKSTLGVVLGSTSQAYVRDELGLDPVAYLSNAVIKAAIRDRHIAGMVVPVEDVPSILATSSEPLVVVGQFPPASTALTYHVALPIGDPLLECVDAVLEKMNKLGQLDALRAKWFTDGVSRTIRLV
ncbi:MAG: transporter substrate-binding domain-containing protein [Actinomycetota bacterium]|nr:transporter substrate-binding domain-containing protein [Actinomycetota bacterium]